MKRLLIAVAVLLFAVSSAFAYDATFNFSQQYPELVSGWRAKAGPTKGGPYTRTVDCKKPAAKTDGTFDCVVPGLDFSPMYGVVVNYDAAGKESLPSAEASLTVTPPPPTGLKYTISGTVTLTPVQ